MHHGRHAQLWTLLVLCAASGYAANRALIVGVRNYINYPELALDGPRNDAERLAALLEKDWKFSPADVSVLIDGQGTKANILNELDRLIKASQRGDHVLFYYSGHWNFFS